MTGLLSENQICPDIRKLRGVSPAGKGNRGLYIVNARVSEHLLCTGQKKVEDKSNEITVPADLIREKDIEETVVSIDGIGCQQEIVQQIMSQKGHYFPALKQNQSALCRDVA